MGRRQHMVIALDLVIRFDSPSTAIVSHPLASPVTSIAHDAEAFSTALGCSRRSSFYEAAILTPPPIY